MTGLSQIKVWDAFVRFFHWSLASAFFIAYMTEEAFLVVHTQAGYLILAWIILRIIWGLVGSPYARFSNFLYRPKVIFQFLQDTLQRKARRYLGHNPAGGVMVVALLVSLLMTTISGILLLGAEEQAGPLASWFRPMGEYGGALEATHEFFAHSTLMLVIIHLAGVLVESLIHKENLVSAMLSGFKVAKPNS